jgi:hypothetical protein
MEIRPASESEFFPSTLEHRPLHSPEKHALKKYFECSGADEYEGFTPSSYAITPELADFEAWIWGMRFWGRECLVRGSVAALYLLADAWEDYHGDGQGDEVVKEAAYGKAITPQDAATAALYWANIPTEEKANRTLQLIQPLPEEWFVSPLHEVLQGRPFFWGALAGNRVLRSILEKRDPSAEHDALACCAAARMRMLAGESAADAVAYVRAKMILALRTWMGHRW